MSVFTTVTPAQLEQWLRKYAVGSLLEMRGIAEGIENTNYFVTTSSGRYVLTLFERLPAEQLPFYLDLVAHLSRHGIPCPAPLADRDHALFSSLNGKPAALVTRLPGAPVLAPSLHHCAILGDTLAAMHLAVAGFSGRLENPRGPQWWQHTAPQVEPFLNETQRGALRSELQEQSRFDSSRLPRGAIHADLFRDNVLWQGSPGAETLGGIIDFYFAGLDSFLFDIAVVANDWCILPDGRVDDERRSALLRAYQTRRRLSDDERGGWPMMLRAAALRFWLSRLFDFYLPRAGALTHAHDPAHFERILTLRRQQESNLAL